MARHRADVLVQPTYYGTDNSLLLQVLPRPARAAACGAHRGRHQRRRARPLHELGVRAIRLDCSPARPADRGLIAYVEDGGPGPAARLARAVLHTGHRRTDLLPFLADFEDTFVIDHMDT